MAERPPRVSPKYFYDERGSGLFTQITRLEEYYPTRVERGILGGRAAEIVQWMGPSAGLVELGSGTSEKVCLLLDAGPDLAAYVPVDIDAVTLATAAETLTRAYPGLVVRPVAADLYQTDWRVPVVPGAARRVVFYPGSTLGNLPPAQAEVFLRRVIAGLVPGDGLLLGVDLDKDPAVLVAAYDDASGVTAAFNRNVLRHLNHLLGSDFDPDAFDHVALYDAERCRIEMHLQARASQTVHLGLPSAGSDAAPTLTLDRGDRILTEYSHKYRPDDLEGMLVRAGFAVDAQWTDERGYFGVWAARVT